MILLTVHSIVGLFAVMFCQPPLEHPEIVRQLLAANSQIESVRVEFTCLQYDLVFNTCSRSFGEVHFHTPEQSHWKEWPDPEWKSREFITWGRRKYSTKQTELFQFHWDGNELIAINPSRQEYQRCDVRATFFGVEIVPTIHKLSPFLPGMTDLQQISDWDFQIVMENAREYEVHATPKDKRHRSIVKSRLLFRKSDRSLAAVMYVRPGGNAETVFIFGTIEKNPAAPPTVDLCGLTELRPAKQMSTQTQETSASTQEYYSFAIWLIYKFIRMSANPT